MKQKLNVGFVTTYSGRWPKELPEQRDKEYGAWLEEQFPQINVVKASQIGCTKEALEEIAGEFKQASADIHGTGIRCVYRGRRGCISDGDVKYSDYFMGAV